MKRFQLEKTVVDDLGIALTFSDGEVVRADFAEVPSGEDPGEVLTQLLNERLVVGQDDQGNPLRHYKANVITLDASTNPPRVAVSVSASSLRG